MDVTEERQIRQMFFDYLRMYSSRDDGLTSWFSEDFSGFTGGGDSLVKDRAQWVAITRQDFAEIKEPIRIDLKDLAVQSLSDTVAVTTGFFNIHLPIKDRILSHETARLVLIFHKEADGWKISHSSISIPYYMVRKGEVYPMQELAERNQFLEELIAERTAQLSEANENLQQKVAELANEAAERKQATDALRRSEEIYRLIVSASPDDITITDREGRVVMVSPRALALFGPAGQEAREEDYLGHPLTDFIVAEDRERVRTQVALKHQGVRTGPSEYRGLRLDGSTFDVEVNSEFIHDSEGAPSGMVVIVRDITERKQAEIVRKKLEAQNRQLQKAESLGLMAGAIAHYFNNQLAAVIANLDLAMTKLSEGENPHAKIAAAMKSSYKAAEMSGLMLTYLGQGSDKHKPVDLCEICRLNLPMLRSMIPAAVTLEADLPSPGPVVAADAKQLVQVLASLTANAWESFGASSGAVQVRVKTISSVNVPETHRFPLDWQQQHALYACMEVTDAGCGIEETNIEKLFDPFFSSKSKGRGMGLAVVLGIVRSHGGAITVTSEPGQGSTFQLFLPVCGEAAPAAE
jgi:PAS domain S-box-containing protein